MRSTRKATGCCVDTARLRLTTFFFWVISVECEPHVCADECDWRRYLGIAPTPGAARPTDDATKEIEAKAREIAAQQKEIKHPDGAFAFLIAALYLFFKMFRLTRAIKLWRHPARALAVGHAAIRILLRILLHADIAVDLVPEEAAREGVRAALASGLAIFVAAGIFVRDDGAHRGSGADNGPLAPLLQEARARGKLGSGASDERLMAHIIYMALSFSLARSIIPAECERGESNACLEERLESADARASFARVFDYLRVHSGQRFSLRLVMNHAAIDGKVSTRDFSNISWADKEQMEEFVLCEELWRGIRCPQSDDEREEMKKLMGKSAWSHLATGGSPLFVGVEIYILFLDGSKELAALLVEVGSPVRGVKPLGLREVAEGSLVDSKLRETMPQRGTLLQAPPDAGSVRKGLKRACGKASENMGKATAIAERSTEGVRRSSALVMLEAHVKQVVLYLALYNALLRSDASSALAALDPALLKAATRLKTLEAAVGRAKKARVADTELLERAAEKLATLREAERSAATLREGLVASYHARSKRPQAQREAAEELVAAYRARSKRPQAQSPDSAPPAKRPGYHQRTEAAAAELLRLEAEAYRGSLGKVEQAKLAKMQNTAKRSQLRRQREDEAHEKAMTLAIEKCPAFWKGRRYQLDTIVPGTVDDTPRKRVLRLRDDRKEASLPVSAAKLLAADSALERVLGLVPRVVADLLHNEKRKEGKANV
ncbi:hypothetical protein EMIHUDRAFT_457859 [Emiliania huxleyi CCMP1516]|uniref:Uncharacterized protein n=2 Tax=Emiliania huxleyi TaxID=2903 RepID=A0A0D3JK37_EMIH1|nr:hypothetical protein EMIHUDRAFT_457859 [Emiliania huxleyi CCMP1516]EOD23872.1 hypothetical protein EMIHUDRAFT_457859 [Emiliania huxleyi CCMP1516]|eukprot:XP_005776301.1 hypothetical protein EMIHUDRAFT_457859 [Emiliania huxleyi CCMP1516]